MSNAKYGRGQVEWALWRTFSRNARNHIEVPKKFIVRIKRLLEIDRSTNLSDRKDPPEFEFSFVGKPDRPGGNVIFSAFDAFCLAVALDLLDAGFKQYEVVFLMRYLRSELQVWFQVMLEAPNLNSRKRYKKDYRVFALIMKYEIEEGLTGLASNEFNDPVFLPPVFCEGMDGLSEVLSDVLPLRRRVATVVELNATAKAVNDFLNRAPEIRRGRPKS